jgi:peroxiredoxin
MWQKKSQYSILIVSLALMAALSYWFFSGKASKGENIAPQVSFTNLKGEKIAMDSLRGKVVIVNFWATSCTTCVAEMPELIKTYERFHQQGLEFFAVAMSYDPPNYVLNFAETRALPFHVALDVDGSLAQQFKDVRMTPTTFLIDKQGKILKRYLGKPSFDEMNALIAQQLKS